MELKAGGLTITMPAPISGFEEVGDQLRTTLFEVLTPGANRLLSAYAPSDTLAQIQNGKVPSGFESYAMVEVPRRAEYVDLTADAFGEVIKGIESSIGGSGDIDVAAFGDELNAKLKTMGSTGVEIGKPQNLGTLFRKPDAFGLATVTAYQDGDGKVTMVSGSAFLRVKQRLFFLYLFREYKSADSVSWVRKNLEVWSDETMAKNK